MFGQGGILRDCLPPEGRIKRVDISLAIQHRMETLHEHPQLRTRPYEEVKALCDTLWGVYYDVVCHYFVCRETHDAQKVHRFALMIKDGELREDRLRSGIPFCYEGAATESELKRAR